MANYWTECHENDNGILDVTSGDNNLPSDYLFSSSPKVGNACTIEIYNNSFVFNNSLIKMTLRKPPLRENEDIKAFSNNARRRFLLKLAHINLQIYQSPIFVTLTYQNILPKNNLELKQHLDNFLHRMRKYSAKFEYVWRLEFQQRGAPHFHFILFPKQNYKTKDVLIYKRFFQNAWRKSIGNWSEAMQLYSVDVKKTDGKRQIFSYLAKYTAKKSEVESTTYKGRFYGFSTTLNLEPLLKCEITAFSLKQLRSIVLEYMRQKLKLSQEYINYFLFDPRVEIFASLEEMQIILDTFFSLKYTEPNDSFLSDFAQLNFDA
jgi:hypothetical protein